MLNRKKPRIGHVRFPALQAVCPFYLSSYSLYVYVIRSFDVIGYYDYCCFALAWVAQLMCVKESSGIENLNNAISQYRPFIYRRRYSEVILKQCKDKL